MSMPTLVATPDPDPRDAHLYGPDAFLPLPAEVERDMVADLREIVNPRYTNPTMEQAQVQAVAEMDYQLRLIAALRTNGGGLS